MRFSIIVPSYNQGKYIEKTLNSILQQNYPDLEIIVIDGGSSDETINILKTYDNEIFYWVSEKDYGQSHAFNKGLNVATGDIIGWLNSDDIYYFNTINSAKNFFQKNKNIDIVFANYDFIDEKDNVLFTRKEILFDLEIYYWTKNCYHANLAGFFRKKCFDRCGGLREDLHFGMDYELYLRFGVNGCKYGHIKEIWGGYRLHEDSKSITSSTKQKIDGEKIHIEYRKHFGKGFLFCQNWNSFYYQSKRRIKKIFSGAYTLNLISNTRRFAANRLQ